MKTASNNDPLPALGCWWVHEQGLELGLWMDLSLSHSYHGDGIAAEGRLVLAIEGEEGRRKDMTQRE